MLFESARKDMEVRNRALMGLELLTGCRQGEARTARMGSIVRYGEMGCWNKGKTKTGEYHEIPVPRQAMVWLNAWLTIRDGDARYDGSPYIFPGPDPSKPLSDHGVRRWWKDICAELGFTGLWNYHLRRTLATYLSNELDYPDKKIQAILNHYDGRALSHYYHVSFDALVPVVQHYADWMCGLTGIGGESEATVPAQNVKPALAPVRQALNQQAEQIFGTVAPSPPPLALGVEQPERVEEWPG